MPPNKKKSPSPVQDFQRKKIVKQEVTLDKRQELSHLFVSIVGQREFMTEIEFLDNFEDALDEEDLKEVRNEGEIIIYYFGGRIIDQ
jgi:hypothetical protein